MTLPLVGRIQDNENISSANSPFPPPCEQSWVWYLITSPLLVFPEKCCMSRLFKFTGADYNCFGYCWRCATKGPERSAHAWIFKKKCMYDTKGKWSLKTLLNFFFVSSESTFKKYPAFLAVNPVEGLAVCKIFMGKGWASPPWQAKIRTGVVCVCIFFSVILTLGRTCPAEICLFQSH